MANSSVAKAKKKARKKTVRKSKKTKKPTVSQQIEQLESRLTDWMGKESPGSRDELALKDALLDPLNQMERTLKAVGDQQQRLLDSSYGQSLLPPGPFLTRLQQENPTERRELARFVAREFFTSRSTPQRCFLQAGTTALHLATVLEASPGIPDFSLMHTNSAVAHLPALGAGSSGQMAIWPFCGSNFDPTSAGWQIPAGDEPGFASLRDLFTRPAAPLHTAFLAPQFVTPREGLIYDRHDASEFGCTLCEADEVVVLAAGTGCLQDRSQLPRDGREFFPSLSDAVSRFTLVVCDPLETASDLAAEFRESFRTVWWRSAGGWEQF